jgi:pantetheine-phosphate adenylyltransferase
VVKVSRTLLGEARESRLAMNPTGRIAIYPGTFDPITKGHLDVLERAHRCFDSVIVGILPNLNKRPLFRVEERIQFILEAVSLLPNVTVETFDGLVVDFAAKKGAFVLVRGLREVSDFENELRMSQMNRQLNDNVVTMFLATDPGQSFVSSSLVKEVASHGGDVSSFVPPSVQVALTHKFEHSS